MSTEPTGRAGRTGRGQRAASRRTGPGGQGRDRAEAPTGAGRERRFATTPGGESLSASQVRTLARNRLIESRLTPNAISMTGLVLNLVAAALVTQRLFLLAGAAFIVGSIMDTLDGRYSRMSGKGTPFGAFLDSTLDRIEESVVLAAIAAYFASIGDDLAAGAVVLAVMASFMVSYTRARAEALGIECKVGVATRPRRVVIIAIGLVFANGAGIFELDLLEPSIYALALLSGVTALQRVLHVRKALHAAAAA